MSPVGDLTRGRDHFVLRRGCFGHDRGEVLDQQQPVPGAEVDEQQAAGLPGPRRTAVRPKVRLTVPRFQSARPDLRVGIIASSDAIRKAMDLLRPADRYRDAAGPISRREVVGHVDDREATEMFL